ncbi:MAG: gamma-glutamyl-gamma-aminobutyrate hydrolase family protein [bacterium]
MMKSTSTPIIGITTYGRNQQGQFFLPAEYVDAVRNAGGLPLLLPPGEKQVHRIVEMVDGLIFAGGGDLAPELYGGQPHHSVSRVDQQRDDFELELARQVLQQPRPVLGICRGFQLLNVATGGDLLAHVPDVFGSEIAHRTEDGESTEHVVQIAPDSRLAKVISQPEITVVSKHHQAAGNIPDVWKIAAKSQDGVVEAMEHAEHRWMIAVLWHPELALQDVHHQRIFQAFVKAAK